MKRDFIFRAFGGEIMLFYEPQTDEEYDYEWVELFFRKCQVMQFTGKYDKNKKPIYEGDIVKSDKKFYSTNLAEVRWLNDRCSFYFVAKTVGTDIINREPYESAYKINSLKVQVIGNIYQNAELLQDAV